MLRLLRVQACLLVFDSMDTVNDCIRIATGVALDLHSHNLNLNLLRAQAWLLMFDSVDTVNDCIRIATGVLSTIAINPERMLAGLSADMLATDLAEYLVRKGTASSGTGVMTVFNAMPYGCYS